MEATFALRAFAYANKLELSLRDKQTEVKAKPAQGGKSHRSWDPTKLQAPIRMTQKTAEKMF